MPLSPILLSPNQPPRPYRGGAGISRLRGSTAPDEYRPEDFVGSVTTIFGEEHAGLTDLPDGRTLRHAIASDPEGFLGPHHVARFGSQPELLVKLLDTAERLFVHLHPDDAFARRHLGLAHGKTEAWVVIGTRDTDDPYGAGGAHLGFRRAVSTAEVRAWVHGQHAADMLDAMHHVHVEQGDTILVPGGTPHSIGAGITVVEVQQPTDLSILLEYDGFPGLGREQAFLGLDESLALSALDRGPLSRGDLTALIRSGATRLDTEGVTSVLPAQADPFFRVEAIRCFSRVDLDPGYSILVVLDGEARLTTETGKLDLARGSTALIPHAAGHLALDGTATALRCRPAAAAAG
ncbi:class I mannose-6-phosphate isomerase [Streptomyces sp. NPDC026672]|uniref:class I mannose-6-phosphate isomerase n=1 Tax=unclassified Streptomyces TaxID=2593676 RepID=UPI003400F478